MVKSEGKTLSKILSESETRLSVCVVEAMTVTESWDRAGQPQGDQIECKPMGVCPSLGGQGDFTQPAAHSQSLLVSCAGCTQTHTHTCMQHALVPLCSLSWYRRRYTHGLMHTHIHTGSIHIQLRYKEYNISFGETLLQN